MATMKAVQIHEYGDVDVLKYEDVDQKGVGELGEQLAPRYGVTFSLPMVHPSGEQMAAMVPLFEAGQIKTHLEAVFPLQDVARAHQLIEGGHVRGKVVLTVE